MHNRPARVVDVLGQHKFAHIEDKPAEDLKIEEVLSWLCGGVDMKPGPLLISICF